MFKINIPLTVPSAAKGKYYANYRLATKKSGQLMLLAADQKIEHLNDDFFGPNIAPDDAQPEHLFKIAKAAKVGVLASQLGLIASYGADYRSVPYLVKLNSKSNLAPVKLREPNSRAINTVEQVVELAKNSRLKIVGVGYTIYLGSYFEIDMLAEASQIIYQAHQEGLLAVLWIYPRGQAVKQPNNAHLLAGAAGLAACLGADFAKLPYPDKPTKNKIGEIIKAAGRTGVIFSGGQAVEPKKFLATLSQQIIYGARGNATGRNIHQHSLEEAVRLAKAISAISVYGYTPEQAYLIYNGKKRFNKG